MRPRNLISALTCDYGRVVPSSKFGSRDQKGYQCNERPRSTGVSDSEARITGFYEKIVLAVLAYKESLSKCMIEVEGLLSSKICPRQ